MAERSAFDNSAQSPCVENMNSKNKTAAHKSIHLLVIANHFLHSFLDPQLDANDNIHPCCAALKKRNISPPLAAATDSVIWITTEGNGNGSCPVCPAAGRR